MKTLTIENDHTNDVKSARSVNQESTDLIEVVDQSWKRVAPFWPLKNLIAVNPLRGFEDLPFESAIQTGASYFQQDEIPKALESVNRETIKWMQAFFDQGQATIEMPSKEDGLFVAWKKLVTFDNRLHRGNAQMKSWLSSLADDPIIALSSCLENLGISEVKHKLDFLTLLLTTLPGWASHIAYCAQWSPQDTRAYQPHLTREYLAVRAAICCMIWKDAKQLLDWHQKSCKKTAGVSAMIASVERAELKIKHELLDQVKSFSDVKQQVVQASAQLVFCIDVRSEPMRKALEASGNYETFGYAGFFGAPIAIKNVATGEEQASCPVLLTPKHVVTESRGCSHTEQLCDTKNYHKLSGIKRFYQSCKYTMISPFSLVETLGSSAGAWMMIRTFWPKWAHKVKDSVVSMIRPKKPLALSLSDVSFEDQCVYAESLLRAINLIDNFSPLVILCGHGSSSQNNIFASSLDCGACGGRHGASNAHLMSKILNSELVRVKLSKQGIHIPAKTIFIPAKHDTTKNKIDYFYDTDQMFKHPSRLNKLLNDSLKVSKQLSQGELDSSVTNAQELKSVNWAETRPEWGLARNSCFIIGPRQQTKSLQLDGRAFLHSYEWRSDQSGEVLEGILTAPVIVAQWINAQYLFSTLDNVAYGAGSKITANVTGKFAAMQGNASDLMHGLPLQSVFQSDDQAFHQASRLFVIINAPRKRVLDIIQKHVQLSMLVRNDWFKVWCYAENETLSQLNKDFHWKQLTAE